MSKKRQTKKVVQETETQPSKRTGRALHTKTDLSLFLGAGASTRGGYPTFLTFPHLFWPTSTEPAELKVTDKERILLASIRRELERKRLPRTLDSYLQILHNYNLVLQNVFSDEELRSRFSESLFFFSRIQELNQLVQRARTHICELTATKYQEEPNIKYLERLNAFYCSLYGAYDHLNIFTTNYDLVPEYFFSEEDLIPCGATLLNGFSKFNSIKAARDAAKKGFPLKWSESAYSRKDIRKTLSLYRLHGCVAWYYERNPDTEPLRQEPENRIHLDLREPHRIRDYFDRLCVLYPGRNQYLGLRPHNFAFEKLYDACYQSDSLLFIGFAFRDIDVASVVFNAIRQRNKTRGDNLRKFRLVIIDPYIDSDQFQFRVESLRKHIGAPIEFEEKYIEVIAIRSEFPPDDDQQIEIILNSLER